jgi:hypothetical protein
MATATLSHPLASSAFASETAENLFVKRKIKTGLEQKTLLIHVLVVHLIV